MNVNDQTQSAEEIRRRMFQIRGELNEDITGVLAKARRLLSWRHYLTDYPKSSLAVAAFLGYLVVPRQREIVTPDADALEQLSKKHKLVVVKSPRDSGGGTVSPLLRFLLSTALRVGVMKATEMYTDYRARQQTAVPEQEVVTS